MRTAMLIAGLAAAGLVGAIASSLTGSADNPLPSSVRDFPRLEARVDLLETEVGRLRDAVEVLRVAQAMPAPAELPAAAVPEPARPEAPALATIPEDELKAKLLEVIEERAAKERETREKRLAKAQAAQLVAKLDRLESKLGLTPIQREDLEKILTGRRKALAELRERSFRGGEPNREAFVATREEAREIRQAANVEIQKLLSATQFETFRKMDDNGRRGQGPGRRRGGDR